MNKIRRKKTGLRLISKVLSIIITFQTIYSANSINASAAGLKEVLSAPTVCIDIYPKEKMYDDTMDDALIWTVNSVFDPVAYAWYNPDLLESGITTDAALFDHWVHTGIYEGRKTNVQFDVDYFIEHNPQVTPDYVMSHMDQAFQFASDMSYDTGFQYYGGYTVDELKTLLAYNPACPDIKYHYTIFAVLKSYYSCETYEEFNAICTFQLDKKLDGYDRIKLSFKTANDFPPRRSSNKRWIDINNYYHELEVYKSNNQFGMMREGILDWEEIYVDHVVDLYPTVHLTTEVAAKSKHSYYGKNLSAAQRQEADDYCYAIAQYVLTDPQFANMSDLEKIDIAAKIVASRCSQINYGKDANKNYKTPYGVAVQGIYTCAGSTRTMGRVLEYMGIEWAHVNENENNHQWCVFYLNGVLCCADGMGGFATYGNGVSYAFTLDGQTIWPSTWRVVYSFK